MRLVYLVLAMLAGAATAVQTPVNASLRTHLAHPLQATFVSFAVGALLSLLMCVVSGRPLPTAIGLTQVPWWAWTGGILGTMYVGCSIILSPKIGVATMLSMVIAGQMLASLMIDHYGLLRAPVYSISAARAAGAILIAAGTAVMAFSK